VNIWANLVARGDAGEMVNRARVVERDDRFDLVVEPEHGGVRVVEDDESLIAAVRHPGAPRAVIVVPFAERIALVRDSFRNVRKTTPRPKTRRTGRKPRHLAEVQSIRGAS